mmetsp:Transcript_12601/g.39100  ORF Transcript_12601/g.39100 Transcript_12601/m.39100 type:complete len:206 (+) Transcript_12601:1246-1863(+)
MPDGTDTGERAVAAARAALMKAGTNTSSFGPGINGGSGNSTASDEAPATGGKARRTKFTDAQIKGLEAAYKINARPAPADRALLAQTLGIAEAKLQTWFQNKRARCKHSQKDQEVNNLIKDMETKVQENGMLRRENEELRRAAASYRRREEELYMWSTAAAAPANSQAEVAAMALPGIPGAIPGVMAPPSTAQLVQSVPTSALLR